MQGEQILVDPHYEDQLEFVVWDGFGHNMYVFRRNAPCNAPCNAPLNAPRIAPCIEPVTVHFAAVTFLSRLRFKAIALEIMQYWRLKGLRINVRMRNKG